MRTIHRPLACIRALAVLAAGGLPACAPRETPPPAAARPTDRNIGVAEQAGGADPLSEYDGTIAARAATGALSPILSRRP